MYIKLPMYLFFYTALGLNIFMQKKFMNLATGLIYIDHRVRTDELLNAS
jgi:hypothetical protein